MYRKLYDEHIFIRNGCNAIRVLFFFFFLFFWIRTIERYIENVGKWVRVCVLARGWIVSGGNKNKQLIIISQEIRALSKP